jgi:hypothetical protein
MSEQGRSKLIRGWIAALGACGCLVTSFGCGGPEKPKDALQAEVARLPKWALGDCKKALKNDNAICGSGSVQGMSNVGLARSAAEGRARTELARSLQVRVKSMLKDYQSGTAGGVANVTDSEQHIEDVSKQVTDLTLSGSRIEDTFISDTGTFWALVVLDAEAFKGALYSKQLDEGTRRAIVERADKSFRELDAATAH